LTPFFGTCQSVEQAVNGEYADDGLGRTERSILGQWAGGGVAADGDLEGVADGDSVDR